MSLTTTKQITASIDLSNKKNWTLSKRQRCDLECLINGAYAPLTGFLDKTDYESVWSYCQMWCMAVALLSNCSTPILYLQT